MNPVVVELEHVVRFLQRVTHEMESRYHKFAKAGARNIDDFNKKVAAQGAAQKDVPGPAGDVERLEKLPYIVVIIDELADLMMLAPDETERTICRLAQMARATGIHLILATQRPSVDVVTGLIKANFPARISFAVASSVDSRVILDGPGAEKLLGRGDMLFVSPDSGQPVRLQGCYVSDKEILKLTRYWKGTRGTTDTAPVFGIPVAEPAPPVQQPLWEDMRATVEKAKGVQEDNLLGRAIEVVKLQRRASISLLQRKLQIGYTRAARLIDLMEQKGVVSPAAEGARWREVLVVPTSGMPNTGDEEF
jgi:S-DNA-T family DNA segregation ATPase FtsK/SpoIIIE